MPAACELPSSVGVAPLCNMSFLTGLRSIQLLHKLVDVRKCPCAGPQLPAADGLVVDGGTSDDAEDAVTWLDSRPAWSAVGFEAAPRRCAKAATALRRYGSRATLTCKALSDRVGTSFFALDHEQQGSLGQVDRGNSTSKSVQVETTTLDREFEWRRQDIFLLKLDLQGGEPSALRGATNLLRSQRIWSLYIEFDPYLLEGASSSAAELLALLHRHSYVCHNFRKKYSQAPWLCNYKRANGKHACWTNLLCSRAPDPTLHAHGWREHLMTEFCRAQAKKKRASLPAAC